MSSRPSKWTKAAMREAVRMRDERRELKALADTCITCHQGLHDPRYGDDGVCRCDCCGRLMADEGYPDLELT